MIIKEQIEELKGLNLVALGDVVVNTGSMPVEAHLPTNMLKVSKVD